MPVARTFDEVLAAAVAFFLDHGFSDSGQLNYWGIRLEKAARRELLSTTQLIERLRGALTAEYTRQVERGVALSQHPGVSKSTLAKIRPALRKVLSTRVAAATELLRATREEEIASTVKRFTGWASSLPAAPSPTVRKGEVRSAIRKTLSRAAFAELRLIVDQGHKLNASIHATIARESGAIACIWISNYKQHDYDYRDEHRSYAERSEREPFLIRNSWAHSQGFLNAIGATFTDQLAHQPAQLPHCRCHYRYIYNLSDLPPHMVRKVA